MLKLFCKLHNDCCPGVETDICYRMIKSCESSIIRHQRSFQAGSDEARRSHKLTCESLHKLKQAQKERGFAADNPRIGGSWPSACFQAIQTGMAAGASRKEIDNYIKMHDETGTSLDSHFEIMETALKPSNNLSVYRCDLLGELFLNRPDRRSLKRPLDEKSWGFDPDRAIALTSYATASIDRTTRSADTAIASLHLVHSEALLLQHFRKFGSRSASEWNDVTRGEYQSARESATQAFTALNMGWKLRRLGYLELQAGVVAEELGIKVLSRKSRRSTPSKQKI